MATKDRRGEASGGEGTGPGGSGKRAVIPGRLQLDPGLLGWRLYTLAWGDTTVFAHIIVTNTAYGSYDADEEYWYADKAAVGTLGSEVEIRVVGDYEWENEEPSPPSGWQQFDAHTAVTWALVDGDLSVGKLYKHPSESFYLRLQKTGSSPNATLTVVRWYRGGSTQPSGTFDPSGNTYDEVTSLGSGSAWFGDSLPPA